MSSIYFQQIVLIVWKMWFQKAKPSLIGLNPPKCIHPPSEGVGTNQDVSPTGLRISLGSDPSLRRAAFSRFWCCCKSMRQSLMFHKLVRAGVQSCLLPRVSDIHYSLFVPSSRHPFGCTSLISLIIILYICVCVIVIPLMFCVTLC